MASDGEMRRAARSGLSVGLRRHLPGAVGLVAKGVPLCALGAFAHLVLGVGIPGSAVSVLLAYLGLGRSG